jgi:hypothetical protein
LLRVLAYPKFGLAAGEIEALLAEYLPRTTLVKVPKRSSIGAFLRRLG